MVAVTMLLLGCASVCCECKPASATLTDGQFDVEQRTDSGPMIGTVKVDGDRLLLVYSDGRTRNFVRLPQ